MAKSIQESALSTQSASKEYFVEQYQSVRRFTEHLCEPLATEDYVIQSMADVSPTKWHIARASRVPVPSSAIRLSLQLVLQHAWTTALPAQTRVDLSADREGDLCLPPLCR